MSGMTKDERRQKISLFFLEHQGKKKTREPEGGIAFSHGSIFEGKTEKEMLEEEVVPPPSRVWQKYFQS